MRIIGFTSGFNYRDIHPAKPEVFRLIRSIGCRAVEIGCIGGYTDGSLEGLSKLRLSDFDGFEHISIHAPTKVKPYGDDEETRKMLAVIEKAYKDLNARLVVIHPNKVADWKVFDEYGFRVAVENMDQRGSTYRTVDDFLPFFRDHDYSFVLDIAHCWANDHSLKLARDLYNNFRGRLCEVHLSGYDEYHRPLKSTGQTEIIRAVPPDTDVPIILESICNGFEAARAEFEFVKNHLEEV